MKYTKRNYRTASQRRRIIRIVVLCVLTLGILVSVLVLGNVLHNRLEEAAPLLALPAVTYERENASEPMKRQPFASRKIDAGIYCTVETSVLLNADEKSLEETCSVASQLYSGISVAAADQNGLCFVRETTSGTETALLPDMEVLRNLCRAARTNGLVSCAVWQLPDNIPAADSDTCAAVRELAQAGFDEILFTGKTSVSLRQEDAEAMIVLANAIKEADSDLRVGFAFLTDTYADTGSAPFVEQLAMNVDYLSVDLGQPTGGDPAEYAEERAASLYGSIAYYPLRILVRGSTVETAAQSAALQEKGFVSIQPVF